MKKNSKFVKKGVLAVFAAFSITMPVYGFDINKNSDLMILVSHDYPVGEEYKPLNTQLVAEGMTSQKSGMVLRKEMCTALFEMAADAKEEGLHFVAISGYRDYAYQDMLFKRQLATQKGYGLSDSGAYSAAKRINELPGASEHQTGLSLDITTGEGLEQSFGDTKGGKWLAENCYDYGFIIRYPRDKLSKTEIIYEPWHIRYVGKAHAKYMKENNLCLEEYVELLQKEGHIEVEANAEEKYEIYYTKDTSEEYEDIIDISRDNMGGYIITTQTPTRDPYEDVIGHWAESYIREIVPKKYAPMNPESKISRGAFYSLLPVDSFEKTEEYHDYYEDVYPTDFYYNGVKNAYEAGLLTEKDSKLKPHEMITRQEILAVFARMFPQDRIARISYTDTDKISGWVFQDIQKLAALGAPIVLDGNKIKPDSQVTLAEGAKLIHDMMAFYTEIMNLTVEKP